MSSSGQVLAAYINPDFRLYELYPEYLDDICNADIEITSKLPRSFLDQVERSCLLPILADYLRNDSSKWVGMRGFLGVRDGR